MRWSPSVAHYADDNGNADGGDQPAESGAGIHPKSLPNPLRFGPQTEAIPYGFASRPDHTVAIGYVSHFVARQPTFTTGCHTVWHRVWHLNFGHYQCRSKRFCHTVWHTLCRSRARTHARARTEKLTTTTRGVAFSTQLALGGGSGGRALQACREQTEPTAMLRIAARAWDKPKPQSDRTRQDRAVKPREYRFGGVGHKNGSKPGERQIARIARPSGLNGG